VTKIVLIVETLKEIEGMLWGQSIKVFTKNKNIARDSFGLTSKKGIPREVTFRGICPQNIRVMLVVLVMSSFFWYNGLLYRYNKI
jgi:hypothetical protein